MITPAMAGPSARAMLIATAPSPTAAGNSSRDTVSGMIACQEGRSIALPAPMASVITSNIHGCTTPAIVSTPSNVVTRNNHTCAMSRMRRRSSTSASAPAGSASKNRGRVVATCTSDTISGDGASNVMSQAAAESCIHVPMFDTTSAIQRPRNSGRRSGLQAEGVVVSVTLWISLLTTGREPHGADLGQVAQRSRDVAGTETGRAGQVVHRARAVGEAHHGSDGLARARHRHASVTRARDDEARCAPWDLGRRCPRLHQLRQHGYQLAL